MNTTFAGNQVGSFVSLDQAGSYPLGYLAQLGPYYNYSQQGMLAQYTYTATQANITAEQDSSYARTNRLNETSGTVLPNSLEAVNAATIYVNAASQINYANQNESNSANLALTNIDMVTKSCQDASYSGYLTIEASQVIVERLSTSAIVIELGNSIPNINPIDFTTLSSYSTVVYGIEQASLSTVTLAIQNRLDYFNATNTLLSNAYTKCNTLYTNLNLVATFASLVTSTAKALVDPMSKIAGKESLVTQYVPSVPLNAGISVLNRALSSLTAVSEAISQNIKKRMTWKLNVYCDIVL